MALLYLKDVVTLKLDKSLCNGCGRCIEVCPHEIFAVHGDRVRILNRDRCIECGACSLNCPTGAILVDSGVGCAAAHIAAKITGSDAACCGPKECC